MSLSLKTHFLSFLYLFVFQFKKERIKCEKNFIFLIIGAPLRAIYPCQEFVCVRESG